MRHIRTYILYLAAATALLFTAVGCCNKINRPDECIVDEESRKVLLLYSAGYNSLRNYLLDDINDLKQGWLPGNGCNDDILLVYTHTPQAYGVFDKPTTPYLIRLYKNKENKVVADTLKTYDAGTISSYAEQLNEVLTYVRDNFTSGSYGMIFSSHATGYLPSGYYSDPNSYVFSKSRMRRAASAGIPIPVPYVEPDFDPSLPMVKSIGQDQVGPAGSRVSYEMELPDFAKAIPMKLDYILFDACLMGGIEVAYELRGKCSLLGFSQAEVLAEGLDYKTLTTHLLQREKPDPQGVCEDYFTQYDIQNGVYRSATISLVDCDRLDTLAGICRDLISTYREGLSAIDAYNVQRFYRGYKHWFYDLESIIREAGASEEKIGMLQDALDQCVVYKDHTPEFMCEFDIDVFSGFSMYLPCDGSPQLDKFYKTLQWNIDVGLVE